MHRPLLGVATCCVREVHAMKLGISIAMPLMLVCRLNSLMCIIHQQEQDASDADLYCCLKSFIALQALRCGIHNQALSGRDVAQHPLLVHTGYRAVIQAGLRAAPALIPIFDLHANSVQSQIA